MNPSNQQVILTVTTGQEVYQKAIAKVQVFVPNSGLIRVGAQALPINANIPGSCIQRLQRLPEVQAIRGEPEDQCGAWKTSVFQVQEGVILQVFGQRRTRWNSLLANANLYLRARHNAAERFIFLKTLQVPGQSTMQEVGVLGRFDLLNPDQAGFYGVRTNPMFLGTFTAEKVGFLFTDEVRSAEIASAEQAVTTTSLNAATGQQEKIATLRSATLLEL